MEGYEKLGVFYLGRRYDAERGATTEEPVLYDARDLTTHAVIIGMTGSGKTGLGVSLLEEAAIDGVPVIVIDPKGDITNLALTFPDLRPDDFRPWVNVEEATRKGLTVDELATRAADGWREGLASWSQGPDRIQRLRDAADVTIYTPGSSAGRSVSLLSSFRAPAEAVRADGDLLRERVEATATSLLALLGIEADPLQDREHILVSNLLHHAWSAGRDLDLAGLLGQIAAPPFDRLGVMDVDVFYPRKDRMALAMQLNALLAAPGFSAWMTGEPLDVQRFLYTPAGKPRVSIFAIHHLDDAARMSFVTLLLSEILAWVRAQPGTTSLRALLYMDEVFGYFPPVANPPSKKPLLTLLKQARAFGLGVVLATQNPVDLDYKGLSNTGTWFIGRLQTDRDKLRVLEALDGATTSPADAGGTPLERKDLDRLLSGLGKRVFLLHSVHEPAPTLFHTRWALSYLRGPLTREQIRALTTGRSDAAAPSPDVASAAATLPMAAIAATPATDAAAPSPEPAPAPEAGVPQFHAPVGTAPPPGASLAWGAVALGAVRLRYASARYDVDTILDRTIVAEIADRPDPIDWAQAIPANVAADDLLGERPTDGLFGAPPAAALDPASWPRWERELRKGARLHFPLVLWRAARLRTVSRPEESEGAFRARLGQLWREERDREIQKLREKYGPKLRALRTRIDRAQEAVATTWDRARAAETDVTLAFGTTLVGALFGRRSAGATTLRRAERALRRSPRGGGRFRGGERARADLERARLDLADLDREFHAALDRLDATFDPATGALERIELRAKVEDVTVRVFGLGWLPFWRDGRGELTPAWAEEPVVA